MTGGREIAEPGTFNRAIRCHNCSRGFETEGTRENRGDLFEDSSEFCTEPNGFVQRVN